MTSNKFAYLVGDYHSDSDNDDSEHNQKAMNITTDWTQCTDASSGHPYYWNIVSKEVTWEIPSEYQQFLEQTALQNPQSLRKWILCYTDDSTPYYFNEVSREISWVKPADFIETSNNNLLGGNSRQTNFNNNSTIEATRTKLNLVPEYNSDESDDDSTKPTEKSIVSPSINSNPTKSQSIETSNETNAEKIPPESKKTNSSKEKPSFASIITGGRSPQHNSVDIKLYTGEEPEESTDNKEDNSNDAELLSQKTFKRKRRIEFDVSTTKSKRAVTSNQNGDNNEPAGDIASSIANLKNKYSNFQKSDSEFVEKPSIKESDETTSTKPNENKDTIIDEQQLLEAKLNFLSQGRIEVSPVQIIQIQLQALQAAHVAEALHSDYLLEWMKNISDDLIKLESDAAPSGWKCIWNREKKQYCYENTTNGEIEWEYPDKELKDDAAENNTFIDDDAMDICTTPPPNEHEDLTTAYYKNTGYDANECAPPPPKWTTEGNTKNNTEKPLDDELASFYSDIAKLEPEAVNDENSCDRSSPNPDQDPSASPENSLSKTDDKKKKKNKKIKKLEPWRSGNLETWINKWQKAKKELDG